MSTPNYKKFFDEKVIPLPPIRYPAIITYGILISLALTVVYWLIMRQWLHEPRTSTLITLFSGLLVAISLIYNGRSFKERIELDRRVFFETLVTHWYKELSPHVSGARKILETKKPLLSSQDGAKKLQEEFHQNSEQMESFYAVLNYLEHMALMASTGMIYEDDLKRAFKSVYKDYYEDTMQFIKFKREKDKDHEGTMFCHFHELSRKWFAS